jgi:hypothetical protein
MYSSNSASLKGESNQGVHGSLHVFSGLHGTSCMPIARQAGFLFDLMPDMRKLSARAIQAGAAAIQLDSRGK